MKRVLSLVLATVMILSLCTFCATAEGTTITEPAQADGYFDLTSNTTPVAIPKTADLKEPVNLWTGNVDFGTSGAGIVSFIVKATGVNTPMGLTRFKPTFTVKNSINWWGFSNAWGGKNTGMDGVGTEPSFALTIPKDGTYILTFGRKPFAMDAGGNLMTITAVNVADRKSNFSSSAWASWPLANDNENATLQLLAIASGNQAYTANFYAEDGSTLIGSYTKEYPKAKEAVDAETTKKSTVLTPDEMFNLSGLAKPTKDSDEQYSYVLQWVDANGNPVDAVYKNMNLYASFKPVANTHAVVTFLDVSGNVLQTGAVEKGTHPSCPDPVKTADDNYNYFFAGWTIDGETTVDLGTYEVSEDVTFSPVFKEDLILKATAELSSDILMSSTANAVKFKLNRTNVTVDAVNGIYEPITSGTVTFTYSDLAFAAVDGKTTVEVPFTSVDANGYVDAVFNLDTVEGVAGTFSHTVTCAVTTASEIVTTTSAKSGFFNIVGQQPGKYFDNSAPVVTLNKNDGDTVPSSQYIWTGNIDFGTEQRGITFVLKATGIETPVELARINTKYVIASNNSDGYFSWHWFYNNPDWGGATVSSRSLRIEKDGYYLLYIDNRLFDGNKIRGVKEFKVFGTDAEPSSFDPTAVNNNENATLQMVAIVGGNLQPTATFHSENGDVYATYQHKYTDVTGLVDKGDSARQSMSLISLYDAISSGNIEEPQKAADENYTYKFNGWVDADGNAVDTSAPLYKNIDLYASFKKTEKTVKYTVTFKDETGKTELFTREVFENDLITVDDAVTNGYKKEDDATGTFTFVGWSLTPNGEIIDLNSYKVTADTVLYAVFAHTDVEFTVTYMDGDNNFGSETVVRSNAAVLSGVPTRATDKYIDGKSDESYNVFDYWATREEQIGEDGTVSYVYTKADLKNIQSDMTVYAVFKKVPVTVWHTVTWVDIDGKQLASAMVADGDDTSTSVKGAHDGMLTETERQIFTGWDTVTTSVKESLTVTATYSTVALITEPEKIGVTASGKVGEAHSVVSEEYIPKENKKSFTLVIKVTGASENNPVSIGKLRTQISGLDSNNSGNLSTNALMLNSVTKDGYYFVSVGGYVVHWVNDGVCNPFTAITLDDPTCTRGGASVDASGEAVYDVSAINGTPDIAVRYYADGKWISSSKYSYDVGLWSIQSTFAPTAASLYNGADLGEDFLYWADKNGNEVTQIYENTDVYAVFANVKADPTAEIKAVAKGETFRVPVIANNASFIGLTLSVAASENVTLTGIDVAGTVFEGATAEFAQNIVLNAASVKTSDIVADGSAIVYLIFTANTDIAEGDKVTVNVSVSDASDIAGNPIVLRSGKAAEYTVVSAGTPMLIGDVNGDGVINSIDVMALFNYTIDKNDIDYVLALGDVNGDGIINSIDVMALFNYTIDKTPTGLIGQTKLVG